MTYVTQKATVAYAALARIMPEAMGPKQLGKRFLMSAVQFISVFATFVWAKAVLLKIFTRAILVTYRVCALRIA